VGGAQTAQQCLRARLVDEIHLGIVPIILGDGLRFFAPLDTEHSDQLQQVKLERTRILESPTRTDMWFRVVR
jgi:dihydrofolate reductase